MALHILPQWSVSQHSSPLLIVRQAPTCFYIESRNMLPLTCSSDGCQTSVSSRCSLIFWGDKHQCLFVPDSGTNGRPKKWLLYSSPAWWTTDFIYRSMAYQKAAESPKPQQSILWSCVPRASCVPLMEASREEGGDLRVWKLSWASGAL